ncbi:MAG: dihydropteroate synthase-like protein [Gammaproteobacteria bacterium]|jgi:dihydropteroate synthase-like protein|tara:strand:+ start:392 stop:1783 length:1392 start_codon:yes stop_codon:yes gene_type:complete
MDMKNNILFITGKLAEKNIRSILDSIKDKDFTYEIRNLDINVAALLTTEMIYRRIGDVDNFNKIILPGKVRGDIDELAKKLKIEIKRGPEELKDLPVMFGGDSLKHDLSKYEVHIFAEITDAPNMKIQEIISMADIYRNNGADIIDIGCLPNQSFPHLSETIQELKRQDFYVSIDSHSDKELILGGKSGADYLLSIKSDNFYILDEVDSFPILIPKDGDMASLHECIDKCILDKRIFIADPILDPINYGFTQSIIRYSKLRERYPDIHIMMGTGNVTELTHADTTGMTMILMGIISELKINHILTTEVSKHCKTVIKENDLARRIILAARLGNTTPKHIDSGLLTTHEEDPIRYNSEEVKELFKQVKDSSYRIMNTDDGVHLFNKKGLQLAVDPFDFFEKIEVGDDTGHAFYLGVELARAQIAHQLGKSYEQDEELKWGCLVDEKIDDKLAFKEQGSTFKKKK